jgi:CheY-like chemotaxis protein
LLGDAGRLRQIILNLVSNAVKFTPFGEVIIRARNLGQERDGRLRLRIEVSDTGIGIPPERRNEVFARFNQLDRSYARRFGGTGIGLAISRSLAELMGGEIGFDSRPEAGTTFWLEVPLALGSVSEGKADVPASSTMPSLKILVVEDNATNQLVARMILSRLGHRVDIASDGLEALAAVSQHNYSLVMMDVSMPTMDGLEATRRMRSLGGWSAEMPIIAMTALATPEDRRHCMEAGMNDFITKPVTREKLEAAICAVVTPWTVNRHSGSGDPAIESAALVQLAEDIGVEGARKVLVTFVSDIDRLGQIALDSARRGDVAEFSRTAHSLKGISSMVGATRLQSIASRLERDARSGALIDVIDACGDLTRAIQEARANVCELLGNAGSPAS